jgi:hypothetical protein
MHARFHIAVAAAALLAGCGLGAPAYPTFGETSYRIEGLAATPDGTTIPTTVYRDGPKMRIETTLANNARAIIVFDQATGAAYVLNPTGPAPIPSTVAPSTTATLPPPSAGTAPSATPGAVNQSVNQAAATSAPPSVIGVAVRVADSEAPQPMESSWAALGQDNARSDGDCDVAGESGREWRPREAGAGVERVACITEDGIVLRLSEGATVLFEATRLERGQQDAALFGVPPGYQIIDPAAVAAQVGETMQHLDSVTGAQPTPTTPAPNPPS